jgi:nucleoporin p58/p45
MKASMQCSEAIPGLGRQIEGLPSDVEYLDSRLETVEGALGRDAVAVGQNKQVIERDSEDAVRLFRAVENLKLPNQFHYSTIGSSGFPSSSSDGEGAAGATDLLSYFAARASELEDKTKVFGRHQREVDTHLRTVEHSAVEGMQKLGRTNGEGTTGDGLREIAGVMRTFEEAILRVAERVGEGREKVVDLSLGGGGVR